MLPAAPPGGARAWRRPRGLAGRAAAAPAGAPPPPPAPRLRLRLAAANIPHPDKTSYGGEDAWFTSEAGGGAAGVADGVGGWAAEGVNPREYSDALMDAVQRYLECRLEEDAADGEDGGTAAPEPARSAAQQAARWNLPPPFTPEAGERTALGALATAHARARGAGSATACVVRLDAAGRALDAANLGDSGFMLLRGGAVAARSPPQQHFFDCPFQLAASAAEGESDAAADAAVFRLALVPGDALVLATDGLLDNLWPAEILALAPAGAADVGRAAAALAAAAHAHSLDGEFASPYAAEAAAAAPPLSPWEAIAGFAGAAFGGKPAAEPKAPYRGGKRDDVTVVVGFVEEESEEEEA